MKIKKNMKMKSLVLPPIIAFLAFGTAGCSQQYNPSSIFGSKIVKASQNLVTKEIKVDNFTHVNINGSIDVTYTQKTGKPDVTIYTSDNLVELLNVEVKGNTLNIGFKKGVNASYNKLEVRISAEKLNRVSIAGSGDFEFANGLNTDALNLSVAGSGDIKGSDIVCTDLKVSIAGSGDINCNKISCGRLNTSIAGSGDLKLDEVTATSVNASIAGSGTLILTGNAQNASYSIAGSGDLFAEDFEVKRASADISGSGEIKCHATDYLKARINGSGSVGYKSEPKELDCPKEKSYKL